MFRVMYNRSMSSVDYYIKRREVLAKNLLEYVQKGLLKSRGKEKYTFHTAKYTNCLAHACFGLPNEYIEEYVCRQLVDNHCCPSPFAGFGKGKKETLENMFEFLKKVGLEVSPYTGNEILKSNQTKVALYFSKAYDMPNSEKNFLSADFHFLRQELNGHWSAKDGFNRRVKTYKTLPETIKLQKDNPYILYGLYVITNPYATAYDINREDEDNLIK